MTIEAESSITHDGVGQRSSFQGGAEQKCDIGPDVSRKIRIQTGVLSRLIRDYTFYVSDSDNILEQIDRMKVCRRIASLNFCEG